MVEPLSDCSPPLLSNAAPNTKVREGLSADLRQRGVMSTFRLG